MTDKPKPPRALIDDYYPCCEHCDHPTTLPADEHTIPCGTPGCPGASPREGSMP